MPNRLLGGLERDRMASQRDAHQGEIAPSLSIGWSRPECLFDPRDRRVRPTQLIQREPGVMQRVRVTWPASQQSLVGAKGVAQQTLFVQLLSLLEGAGGVGHGCRGKML